MAYAGRMPDRNKTLAVIAVAGLHGMALYGLVTGLGVDYVKEKIAVLAGHNIPIDPPPPPPREPVKQVSKAVPKATDTAVPVPVDVARNPFSNRDDALIVPDLPIRPVDLIFEPRVLPTPERLASTPKSVRARNDPGSWVSTSDYPAASLRRGEQGLVRFELSVGADGRPSSCQVTASSGSAELDAATCRNVTKRARFEPATDTTGARVSGTYTGTIRWVIPQD